MKAKEFIPQSKPRNFVAKNQKTAGAGAHKDKKRAEKQGDVKHKQKQFEQGVAEGENLSIGQQMAKDGITYSPEKEKELIKIIGDYMEKNGYSPKQIRYYLSYDEDFIPDQLSELPRKNNEVEEMRGFRGVGGARSRENDENDKIDAVIRQQDQQRRDYEQTGKFWLKQKDTQQHISKEFVGKAAANKAALELLKQQPELKGNIVITAYGPGEK
jgi:hypothetical protein